MVHVFLIAENAPEWWGEFLARLSSKSFPCDETGTNAYLSVREIRLLDVDVDKRVVPKLLTCVGASKKPAKRWNLPRGIFKILRKGLNLKEPPDPDPNYKGRCGPHFAVMALGYLEHDEGPPRA